MAASSRSFASRWPAWTLARRELRGGLKGFRVFLACLVLGVAAIASVGSLRSAIVQGLEANGKAILGGDIDLRLTHRAPTAEELEWLRSEGEITRSRTIRAMAGPETGKPVLVELKAVDSVYPLYGEVALTPAMPLPQALEARDGVHGAVAEETLLRRLDLEIGDRVRVGTESFELRAVITREPDKGSEGFELGPRLMIANGALDGTGLITTGSLYRYHVNLRLPEGATPEAFQEELTAAFPDAGWRIRDFRNGAPGLKRFVDRVAVFLTLVGLTALIVGGVGIANAIRSYLESRAETIATLKCLGAGGGVIFQVYFLQIMVLTAVGVGTGLAIGIFTPALLAWLLADKLPVPAAFGVYPAPLALAAAFGFLTAFLFALWPLSQAREIPAAGLFRAIVSPVRRMPRRGYLVAMTAGFLVLAGLALWNTGDLRLGLSFIVGTAASFVLLLVVARGLMWASRRLARPRNASLRLGLANIHRPGAATESVMLSLGLGLTLLVSIAVVEGNLRLQVDRELPDRAPAFFFLDIRSDQVDDFLKTAESVSGVEEVRTVPALRGRIVRIDGVPATEVDVAPDAQWALRGDRGITYSSGIPEGSTVVAGAWWEPDYNGPPAVSLDERIAKGFGVGIGDTLTVNVLGREVTAEIRSLRSMDWRSLSINFVMVFDPSSLAGAPFNHLATARATDRGELALFDAVTDRFPNVSVVRMKEALNAVSELLSDIAAAVRATAAVTLIAGILVLAGAMAAGHRRRVYDAVILKVLGATRNDVLKAYIVEYAILGFVAALIAAIAGTIASYAVIEILMGATWHFLPLATGGTAMAGVVLTVLLGLTGTWATLGARPAPILRTA